MNRKRMRGRDEEEEVKRKRMNRRDEKGKGLIERE